MTHNPIRFLTALRSLVGAGVVALAFLVAPHVVGLVHASTIYTVQPGDTLSLIAPRFGVSWQSICSANHLASCDMIYVGQTLQIPDGGGSAPTQIASVSGSRTVPTWLALGKPYVYGGSGPYSFDCSGLTQYLAAQMGYSIPRTVAGQSAALRHIPLSAAIPGDIIQFNDHHVGMITDNSHVIQALNPAQGIRITTIEDGITYNGFYTALAVGH